MFREILPNVTEPIVIEGTVRLGYAVFAAATLAVLGFSLQPAPPGRPVGRPRRGRRTLPTGQAGA